MFERTPGAATRPLPLGYRPRRPRATAFYRVIADHLETMLQDARDRSPHGFGLPRYVEDSFRRLLDCGVEERGFARVVCPSCEYEILVPFSFKVRGLCPSCDGRRMASGAADLVDHILPVVADYRQWTLSFPRWLRIRLLRDKALVSEVLLVFVRVGSAYHRRRARHRGIAGGQTGAVTAILCELGPPCVADPEPAPVVRAPAPQISIRLDRADVKRTDADLAPDLVAARSRW